ncbi:c-type cytochrome [Roseiconus nitratireducens]|uniref:C-type cytochrome n=1 Tax=Roseiconus nitratireducens TaxID=2605748 RepID=A0A5M6DDD5_9BACT|nr:c-type cytochrome [Roseiconus nitratireducens]KAA5544476.1 c-type cytochrome [Roseiconus nitratireducens]
MIRTTLSLSLMCWCLLTTGGFAADGSAGPSARELTAAERGYRFLIETAILPGDFDQETFDSLWKVWPEPLRSEAEQASPERRREMAFARYGLTPRPGDESGKPLQYVVDDQGRWTMNCFSCHGGSVDGMPTPGAPNNRFALQTLTEEIGKAKILLGRLPGRMELGALFIPLGTTNGTTNAVVFGMGLMNGRDEELNVVRKPPKFFVHHDMDAPPWWYFHKRPNLYIDGFAEKGHRGLMQFALVPENGPEFFREHENDFRDVYAYLSSLRPPEYPHPVDATRAEQGRAVFNDHCARCHGTPGADSEYPNVRVPLDEVGTDPVRLQALTVEGRQKYARSWFAHAQEADPQQTVVDPDGYVAPPLDGVWASAPYFHNGSVPTLWHVLHPDQRPTVWRPVSQRFNREKVGLEFEEVSEVPAGLTDDVLRRSYFDTRKFGKSNVGHRFPEELTEDEKESVLEYLKTF